MANQLLALVTGGNRGIGFQIVSQLCKEGYQTLFTSRNPHDGQAARLELAPFAKLLDYHPLDVSDNSSITALAEYVRKKYQRLDILINNAGGNYDTWQRVSNVDIGLVEYTISVNFLGPWRMCNAFIPLMKAVGGGRIINVSSGVGTVARQDGSTPAYSLSKNGLNMLTKSLAADLEGTGITVNAVCPGWTRTDLGGPEAPRSAVKGAETIVWLATRIANDLTGGFYRDKQMIFW